MIPINTKNLMLKATQAITSAHVLLDIGDADGACNRAYYAMFDAARAALLALGYDTGKTHKGVLNTFSEYLVKTGIVQKETGRLLKQAEAHRYIADYEGDSIELVDAQEMVKQAQIFVTAMDFLTTAQPPVPAPTHPPC